MKPRLNREIVIGLSVLLLLLATFVGLAIRRCLRPAVIPDSAAAVEEVGHEKDHAERRAEREAERLQKPDVLTPAASAGRDSLHALDDPGHWKSEKEQHKESLTGFPPAGPMAGDPTVLPSPQEGGKPHRHEAERTYASPETPAVASDDRYAIPSQPPAGEHRKPDSSQSTVIQVSDGDSNDAGPRPLDRYEHHEEHQDRHDRQGQIGTAAGDAVPPAPLADPGTAPPFRPAAGMPRSGDATQNHAERVLEHQLREAAAGRDNAPAMPIDAEASRRQAERSREREFQGATAPVDVAAPRSTYAGEQRRASPETAYSGVSPVSPRDANPPGYGGVVRMSDERGTGNGPSPGGYAPDRFPRGEVAPREVVREQVAIREQTPLRDDGMYEVQPNDSYWAISERVYGSGAYFRALAEANRGRAARPDRLPPGLLIATPPVARLEKEYPDLCPRPARRETVRNRAVGANLAATAGGGRTYVVQEGDTLSSIARHELGKVSRWAEIYQLNREALGKDYDYLTPGMRLVLPIQDSQQGDRTTRRDDSGAPLMR